MANVLTSNTIQYIFPIPIKNGQNLIHPSNKTESYPQKWHLRDPILDFEIFKTCHTALKVLRNEKQ